MIALAHVALAITAPPQTFRFPDGSLYRGGVKDGMQDGLGEWRSAEGDVYLGSFVGGVFEGHGRHADSRGNCYEGEFSRGAFHGLGTYFYADGRAECCVYESSREVGEGVLWSQLRERAWRLLNGAAVEEISLPEAAEIAASIGQEPPPSSAYSPSVQGAARLDQKLRAWADGEIGESNDEFDETLRAQTGGDGAEPSLAFDTHIKVAACKALWYMYICTSHTGTCTSRLQRANGSPLYIRMHITYSYACTSRLQRANGSLVFMRSARGPLYSLR